MFMRVKKKNDKVQLYTNVILFKPTLIQGVRKKVPLLIEILVGILLKIQLKGFFSGHPGCI